MRPSASCPLVPSSSLPPLSGLNKLPKDELVAALENLSAIYSPLRSSLAFKLNHHEASVKEVTVSAIIPVGDSGYASDADYGEDVEDEEPRGQSLAALRADPFERSFVQRWLTGFIIRAEEGLPCLGDDEDASQRAIDQASCVLESFFAGSLDDEEGGQDDDWFVREFSFDLAVPGGEKTPIQVKLNDGLAGRDSEDHEDVGLQSWGGAIILSELLCAEPARFGLTQPSPVGPSPRIVELGAGTGLISLVLGRMLPYLGVGGDAAVIATDYHPTVLENLRSNLVANTIPAGDSRSPQMTPISTTLLDWSAPSLEAPLDIPADMLIATDVVYAPEHAMWLRDCAARLLRPGGVFWLLVTVRHSGRFRGISDTVEVAFASGNSARDIDGRRLTVVESQMIDKRRGVGRGDESGYKLLKIEWA